MIPVKPCKAPRKRARYHHGDLRNALLRAAEDLVARRGVEGFSLREAARRVGVSAAAAYRHFEDRSVLLAELAIEGMGRLAERMEDALAGAQGEPGTPARAAAEFGAIGAAYVEFAVANPSQFRVMFGPWCEHPDLEELPPEMFPRGRDPYLILSDVLDALVRAGAIQPDAREGAEIVAWAAVHGLSTLLVERSIEVGAAERAQAFGAVTRTLLLGLGVSPALLPLPVAAARPPDARSAKARQRAERAKRAAGG